MLERLPIASRYHDAEILALRHDRRCAETVLWLLMVNDEERAIRFRGVRNMRATQFMTQNVISRVLRSDAGDFSSDDINRWLVWVSSTEDGSLFITDVEIAEIAKQITAGDLRLVVFEPSWGLECVILQDGEIEEEGAAVG
ncbi:MAG: hypothetical protein KA106_01120 [Ferrovibrio sp.]|nr:hypothetical protein [Ferrovibrio sp.]